jgi:hypothetical protein
MNDADVLAYVKAAAALLQLPLDDARAHAVAGHLGRTVLLARQLESFPMAREEEPSEIFCPAEFPALRDSDYRSAP